MKQLLLVLALALGIQAAEPYVSTSGDVTITVSSWSSNIVPTSVSAWRPVTVTGTWITACGANSVIPKRVIITHIVNGEAEKLVEDFAFINDAGNGLHCGNVLKLIQQKDIIGVSVVTASTEFETK